MNKPQKIKLKKRPTKPERSSSRQASSVYGVHSLTPESLAALIEEKKKTVMFAERGRNFRLEIDKEEDYYGSTWLNVEIVWDLDEDEEIYQRRLDDYKKRLEKYEQWYTEHKDQIAAYEAYKVEKAAQDAKEQLERDIRANEAAIKRAERELKKLKLKKQVKGG